ncbi:MAG: helix-turn-helix domain-containing protein, partial [Lachnospiraceae bacterium]|nr:helix-turn-helix domain-containing protein [Lachnospiraceae bacterium]
MKEKRYFISDAAKELEVESHVLRYWEEELNLDIPRNEMGHRYYREEEIQMLQCIKELKERGFQLKTIKQILSELAAGKGQAMDKL